MPLITTLIPAYKPEFLPSLFASLQSQSLRDFCVILSDDSPGLVITELLRSGKFDPQIENLNLTVVRGPGGSALKNHQYVLDAWANSTPLVHLLMDDDVIYPEFYKEHATLHAEQRLAASVSLRLLIGSGGEVLGALPLPDFVTESNRKSIEIDAHRLFASTVACNENWLGELSNMVFSAEAAICFPRPPVDGVSYFGLPDIGLLLNAARIGPIRVRREFLGGFRQHAGQTTANTQSLSLKIAHLAWVAFALQAFQDGYLDKAQTVRGIEMTIKRCLLVYRQDDPDLMLFFALVNEALGDLPRFSGRFASLWQTLLSSCPDTSGWAEPQSQVVHAKSRTRRTEAITVIDDFFPNLLTGFRVAEYNAYLTAFPLARVLSTSEEFSVVHAEYARCYPLHADRILPLDVRALEGCELVSMNFLNNASRYLDLLEALGIPFVLTLYPGGGFGLGCPDSDAKLERVLSSPLLQRLIVTQPITGHYVQEFAKQRGVRLPILQAIHGCVINPLYFSPSMPRHEDYFGVNKECFDVCFVAEKYMFQGINKGYPEFVTAAHELLDIPFIRFHVVGGLGPEDIDVRELADRIRFYGRLETSNLQRFFTNMDLLIALSRPASLHNGNFDGFPTGCAVEASLSGVAVLASDELSQNPGYIHDESILIVPLRGADVVRQVRELVAAPQRLASIAHAGRAVSRRLFSPDAQIAPRIALLEEVVQRLR